MYHREEKWPSNGQLRKLYTFGNTPLPVMSGAMAACSMRSGALDTSRLVPCRIQRYSQRLKYIIM